MENFFYNDTFYSSLEDLIQDLDLTDEAILNLPDDYAIVVMCTTKEPIVTLSADWIAEHIDDDRFSEDHADREVEKIIKILSENIDFDLINLQIPELYYGNRTKYAFTKSDLVAAIS